VTEQKIACIFIANMTLLFVMDAIVKTVDLALIDCFILGNIALAAIVIAHIFLRSLREFFSLIMLNQNQNPDLTMKSLFQDDTEFEKFRDLAIRRVFFSDRFDWKSIIFGLFLYSIVLGSQFYHNFTISTSPIFILFSWYEVLYLPWSGLMNWFTIIIWSFLAILIISVILSLFRMTTIVRTLCENPGKLNIGISTTNLAEISKLLDATAPPDVSMINGIPAERGGYATFYYVSKRVTTIFLRISLLILFMSILFSINTVIQNKVGIIAAGRFEISLGISIAGIFVGVIVVMVPQLKPHELMIKYRIELLKVLGALYESELLHYMESKIDETRTMLDALHIELDYSARLSTWSQSTELIGKLLVPIAVTILSAFAEPLFSLLFY
jgi:hypothetical protein